MSRETLEKIRKINSALHTEGTEEKIIDSIAEELKIVYNANIVVINKNGKCVVMKSVFDDKNALNFEERDSFKYLKNQAIDNLISIHETKENVSLESIFGKDMSNMNEMTALCFPLFISREKHGALIAYKNSEFSDEDVLLGECASASVGILVQKIFSQDIESNQRKISIVKSAIGTLSYSELEAILHIFEELNGKEGLLIASKIADKVGITRSVIVNALRKCESAGVIESRSLGMKGTYIKVLNEYFTEELDKLRK